MRLRNIVVGKKGQLGETATWIVATIIIIVLTAIFIFVSNLLGTGSSVVSYFSEDRYKIPTGEAAEFEGSDVATQQMLFALMNKKFIGDKSILEGLQGGGFTEGIFPLVGPELDRWKEKGVDCDFGIQGSWYAVGEAEGKVVRLEYRLGEYVMLRC